MESPDDERLLLEALSFAEHANQAVCELQSALDENSARSWGRAAEAFRLAGLEASEMHAVLSQSRFLTDA